MTLQMISLKEVLDYMKTGQPFTIQFKTANRAKKTGGKTIVMKNAVLTQGGEEAKLTNGVASHPTEVIPAQTSQRDPNHYENRTRNITVKGTQQIRKVHNRLITRFNGKKVMWGK